MSEYSEVEQPFLQQLATQGWTVVDQGCANISQDPVASLRRSFREWLLPGVFAASARRINTLNEVDKVLPQYRERKEWLRQRGAHLDL